MSKQIKTTNEPLTGDVITRYTVSPKTHKIGDEIIRPPMSYIHLEGFPPDVVIASGPGSNSRSNNQKQIGHEQGLLGHDND